MYRISKSSIRREGIQKAVIHLADLCHEIVEECDAANPDGPSQGDASACLELLEVEEGLRKMMGQEG